MRRLKSEVPLKDLAAVVGCDSGKLDNRSIAYVGGLHEASESMLTFSTKALNDFTDCGAALVVPQSCLADAPYVLPQANPRLGFVRLLTFIVEKIGLTHIQEESVSQDVVLGNNVTIGNGVIIGDNVTIGNNVVLADNVIIGDNCHIKSGAVIGEAGFGFERDENEVPIRFPHIGNVVIGQSVEVGSMVTINRGTLGSTIVEDNVKIDDHVHIAHNCHIGKNTMITAGTVLGGSVSIGEANWLGLNSAVHQKLKFGRNVTIGVGANIFSDAKDDDVLGGFPARRLPKG